MTFEPDAASHMAESRSEEAGATGIAAKLADPPPTWGEKIALEAQRIADRLLPEFPWLRPLEPVRERVVLLPVPSQARFQRTEALRAGLSLHDASREPFEAVFPPLQQAGLHPDHDLVEQAAERSSQVVAQPLFRELQQHQQSFFGDDEEANRIQAQAPSGGGRQLPEWGQQLPALVQQRLRDSVGPGTETIRVHSDEVADAVVRTRGADAVAVGHHVFFRKGHYRPREREGFALLAHEAMHVVQAMRPDSAWKRATLAGMRDEEQEAMMQERKALAEGRDASSFRQPTVLPPLAATTSHSLPAPGSPHVATVPTGLSSPMQPPMAAATDRSVDKEEASHPSMPDVEELKRMVYRDLMRQIRADLERGG